jgi:hypothetical protein
MRLVYRPSFTHDTWLLQWYACLVADGELGALVAAPYHPAAAFLHVFQPPARLHLDVEPELGPRVVQFAVWYGPFLDGVALNIYAAPERRHTRAMVQYFVDEVAWACQQWPVVAAWARDPRLVRMYQKFGLRLAGGVPKARAGQTMWLLTVTAEQHQARVERMERHARRPVAATR